MVGGDNSYKGTIERLMTNGRDQSRARLCELKRTFSWVVSQWKFRSGKWPVEGRATIIL